jgi:hypothetical protein
MRELTISCPSSTAIIRGVPFSDLAAFSTLMTQLQALWAKDNVFSIGDLLLSEDRQLFMELCQKVANLHPRVDTPGEKGFDVTFLLDDRSQLESLFLLERNGLDDLDIKNPCKLMTLNGLDARKKLFDQVPEYLESLEQPTQLQESQPSLPDSSQSQVVTPLRQKSSKQDRSGGSRTSAVS